MMLILRQEEKEFRVLAGQLYRHDYDDSIMVPISSKYSLRPIIVTPYDGAYGFAGYVICINGSPPRGTFVTAAYETVIYITSDGHARRLREQQALIVQNFLYRWNFDRDAEECFIPEGLGEP